MSNTVFRFGDWQVSRATNTLEKGALRRQMEPRAMDVLFALCKRANSVVSVEELLEECWGSTLHGDNPVHKTITQLRRQLGDSSTAPLYIETIRKRGYRTIADVSFDALPSSALPPWQPVTPGWTDGSPFRGLQAFDGDHAAVFFGRADATLRLTQVVRRQVHSGRALALVLGPSGSGKTSLIRAGLLPALSTPDPADLDAAYLLSHGMLDMGELNDGELFSGLGGALLDWQAAPDGRELAVFSGESAFSLGRRLENDAAGLIAAIKVALAGTPPQARLALFLDRFEAVFAQPSVTALQREALVAVIDALARSPRVVVILACRNDFYPRIADYPALLEGKANGGHFDLGPPTHAEITQIIRLPALAAGLTFGVDPATQSRLDDVLCQNALASPDALPLLQYTLNELYRLRSDQGELGFEAYHHLGGVEGALGKRAEEVIAALPEAQRGALPRVLSLIVTISGDGDSVTSRRAPWSALASETERALVQALVEARLLISELVNEEAGFGVAHEALLRRWDRVSAWVAAHRESLQIRSRIAQMTARWVAEKRPSDLLLPQGKQLDEARGLLGMTAFSLTPDELALIGASSQRAHRREQLRLGIGILIVALAVLAAVLGGAAVRAKQLAQQRRAEAESLMGFMLGDFADKLRPLARLDLLDGVSAKAMEYLAVSDESELSSASLSQRAKALEVIGEVDMARGNSKDAMAALSAAHQILQRQLSDAPRSAALLKQAGGNAFWLGNMNLEQSDWQKTRDYFGQYLDYADRLSQLAPDDVDAWVEQSYAHNSLGTLAIRSGDSASAAAEFVLSIGLKEKALARKPGDRTLQAELADSLSWAGSAKETSGELDAAMAEYEKEFKVVSALHRQSTGEALWSNRMALSLQHQGALKLARGQEQDALADYRSAETILRDLIAAQPENRLWSSNLASVRLAMLRIQQEQQGAAAVLDRLSTLNGDITALLEHDPKRAELTKQLAQTEQRIAIAQLELGRPEAALAPIEDARQRLQALTVRNPADLRTRLFLVGVLLTRASIATARHEETDSRGHCAAALALLGDKASASSDFRILDPWVRAHQCLADSVALNAATARLSRIGYRDAAFVKFLPSVSSHP